jgi:hypothetical protein
MKLCNFLRFDPAYKGTGLTKKKGRGELEEIIWNEFANDQSRLKPMLYKYQGVMSCPIKPIKIYRKM